MPPPEVAPARVGPPRARRLRLRAAPRPAAPPHRATSASRPRSGRSRWPPRSPSPRGSRRAARERRDDPPGTPTPGRRGGSGPRPGSPAPTRPICEKSGARPADPPGRATPDWVLGSQDEVWWSRLARPGLHAWSDGGPMRLHEPPADADDRDPKALACYGILARRHRRDAAAVRRRPPGQPGHRGLSWPGPSARLAAEGKRALLLVWDNASLARQRPGPVVDQGRTTVAPRPRGACRIVACWLPVKAPWLNAIEPKWVHGKRAIVEPDGS